MNKNNLVAPVLKWAGGKRKLLPEIKKYIPEYTTYFEPFIGGGALLFELQPNKCVINDKNTELMNVYKVIKDNVETLITELSNQVKYNNTSNCFYQIRKLDRNIEEYSKLTNIEKAARTLYLNKTCYNGLYRVNSEGKFNTPFGKYKNPNIINETTLREVSKYFNNANITFLNCDFIYALQGLDNKSFIYLDPPYEPISKTSNFTEYNANGFGKADQIRLIKLCDILTQKGIKFLLSSSNCEFIRDLYKDYEIIEVEATRTINCKSNLRGTVKELLIKNYD